MSGVKHWVSEYDTLRLGGHGSVTAWWTVRCALGHFAVVTRQAAFHPKGTLEYAAIDFDRKVRGPVNLIGGGYGDGTLSDAEVWRMLAELLAGEIAVTYRNPAPLDILEHQLWGETDCNCHTYERTAARPSNSGGPPPQRPRWVRP